MISIHPVRLLTSFQGLYPKSQQCRAQRTQEDKSALLNKSHLALAAIGIASLIGCSPDNSFERDIYEDIINTTENDSINKKRYSNFDISTDKQVDNILTSLGLLGDSTSVKNIKTIYCRDNNGLGYWIAPAIINENTIYDEAITLLPDCSPAEKYSFVIKSSPYGGIDYEKKYENGNVKLVNYELNNNGTVSEFDIINGKYKLEKSVFKRLENGSIERTYSDGSKIIYGNIENDIPFPTPITFDADVDDYEE